MATFHVEDQAKLTILANEFGMSHVIEKCLCAMFDFHLRIVHASKNDACTLTKCGCNSLVHVH